MDDLPKEISAPISLSCPRCRSSRLWRAGVRHSTFGDQIQRWFCRDCRFRFSDPEDVQKAWSAIERFERQSLKSGDDIVSNSQICVTETKNLAAEQQKTEVLRRNDLSTAKGKIVEYEFWMMKQGYAKTTIEARGRIMNRLVRLGANLYDPEQIKEIIAKQPWSEGRKEVVTETYSNYLVMAGGKWNPPKYHRIEKNTLHPHRTRNRPTNRRMRRKNHSPASSTQRNRDARRRSMETQMDRHQLRKRNNQHNTRKRQPRPHV